MSESELSQVIRKHELVVTPSGSYKEKWVAYNHDHTGRGSTPDEAVRDVVRKIEGGIS